MKRLLLKGDKSNTLKKVYDVWDERPRIIAQEISDEADFCNMVYPLEQHNQIIHIAMS